VGGLVGWNDEGTVRNAFASGSVTGSSEVGGLVGYSPEGTVQESYWDVDTTGQPTSDGGTGLTTAQMTGEAARTNMTGLTFGTVWETRPGDYPALIALSGTDTPETAPDTPGIAPYEDTTPLDATRTTPDGLAGKVAVEAPFAPNASVAVRRATPTNYTLALTADEDARNGTVYLQTTAISASQDIEDLTMYVDGEEHPFMVNESAGPGASSWVAFNVPHFSTRTVTFRAENATLDLAGGSVAPETVTESTTVTHDVGAVFENVSQDGDTDRFYVTMPDAVAGANLSINGVNATDLADGSDVSITSSPELIDGPDEDAVMETVTFAVSSDATGTTDVMVNVSVDVTWPAVEADTSYQIMAAGEDSATGSVPLTVIAEATVTSEPDGTDTETPGGTTTPEDTDTETETPGGTMTPGGTETPDGTMAPDETDTESSGQPGFGIALAVVALLAVGALRRKQ
jgi:PGF-CTERM protein